LQNRERLEVLPKSDDNKAAPQGAASGTNKPCKVKPGPTDRLSPVKQRGLLNAILDELELKRDRDGNLRTAYSLRHTYICFRLMEGADIYQIAKNCRTGVEMIEKFYATHIKTMLDASAINVERGTIKRERQDRAGEHATAIRTDQRPAKAGKTARSEGSERGPKGQKPTHKRH
jgi:hypothetical protein